MKGKLSQRKYLAYGLVLVGILNISARVESQLVNLSNRDSNNPIFWFDGNATVLAPTSWTFVQVFGRPTNQVEFKLLRSDTGFTEFFLVEPGFFDGELAEVPGVEHGDPAEFFIRAWHATEVRSWDAALANRSAFVGQSAIFQNPTKSYPTSPGFPYGARFVNAPSFTLYQMHEICRRGIEMWPRPFCFSVTRSQEALAFQWTDVGTNYLYTLQSKGSLGASNWIAAPGPWPSRTNQWIIQRDSNVATRFYRVRAEKTP